MGFSARKVSTRSVQLSPEGISGEDDPHDAIEREFLGLWLGLARLREQVLGHRARGTSDLVAKRGKRPVGRKARRKAA